MPTKIQSEGPFRLRTFVIAFFVLLGSGYVGGVVHAQTIANRQPQPCPAVTSFEHTRGM